MAALSEEDQADQAGSTEEITPCIATDEGLVETGDPNTSPAQD